MRRSILNLLAAAALYGGDADHAVRAAMRKLIAGNEIPGAVTVVATRSGIRHIGVIGHADAAKTVPLRKDSIFWIASMTKPVTAVAVLMMQDEGKLSIDDPVSKHIPEFAGLRLSNGQPARVTLKQMLTHTSGMGEATPAELGAAKTLSDLVPVYAGKAVGFEPGSQWRYCQSGINMLARVVEVVSGKPFDRFVEERLFQPLGMKDTAFYVSAKQLPRVVTPVRKQGDTLIPAEVTLLGGKTPDSRDRYPAANGGLFSTAPDYARFARMLLRGGELDGKRYLSRAAFELMTAPHTASLKAGFLPGHAWGLGVGVVREPQGQTAMMKPGTFGHGGAYGTQVWIDPQSDAVFLLMIQRAGLPNSDDSPIRLAFQTAAAGPR